jgi:hypothetical protein
MMSSDSSLNTHEFPVALTKPWPLSISKMMPRPLVICCPVFGLTNVLPAILNQRQQHQQQQQQQQQRQTR